MIPLHLYYQNDTMDGIRKYLKYLAAIVALASVINAAPTRPQKALSICDGENLSEQLQIVCAELRAKEKEELTRERLNAYPKCKEIIEPDLRELCIQLEVAKVHEAVNVTSESGEVDMPLALVNITTPKPSPALKEHPGKGQAKGKGNGSEEKTTPAPAKSTARSGLGEALSGLLSRLQESDNPLTQLLGKEGANNLAAQLSNSDLFKGFQQLLSNNSTMSDMTRGLSQLRPGDLRETFVDFMKQQGFDVSQIDTSQLNALLGNLQSDSRLNNLFGNRMGSLAGRLLEIWQANEIGLELGSQSPLLSLANRLVNGRQTLLGNNTQSPPALGEISLMRPHPLEVKSNSSEEGIKKLIPINRNSNPSRSNVDLRNINVTQLPVQPPRLGMIDPDKLNGLISTELRNQGLAQILRDMGSRLGGQLSVG